ncbi:MAG: lipase family protein [Flavobacteriales bacterium]|nr:lipase family protein [Flavobacteriales bacterium]MCB9166534.1 lipase family protein [Flavobacteriales bacterium]
MIDLLSAPRHLLFVAAFALGASLPAQLLTGFDPEEARDMVSLCTTHTFKDLYGDDQAMIPDGYDRVHIAFERGLDNMFQVFRKGAIGVIEFRGSTADPLSWMENIHSAMIPARGTIAIDGRMFDYDLADDTAAAVHAGYTLGIGFLADDVVDELIKLREKGVRDILITGHSQGGALALLMRAYLERLSTTRLPGGMRFKTYAFANPMVGNTAFAAEYERSYVADGSSFSIVNPKDPVTKMPLSYDDGSLLAPQRIAGMLMGQGPSLRSTARDAFFQMFSGQVTGLARYFSNSITKRITGSVGEVRMPPFREEMNYTPMPGRVELDPFPYPLILRDSTILRNDSIMRANPRDANGVFTDRSVYKAPPNFFQHKPYNYYVAILERYFPDSYARLAVKVLPENL